MLNTAQRRNWAALLRERYTANPDKYRAEDVAAAIAQADLIEAQADLDDAQAGRKPQIADSCAVVENYPILGRITREGGIRTRIEHPWTDEDAARIESAGVMLCMEMHDDPRAGMGQGRIGRIYVGTRDAGPIASWDCNSRKWHRLRSNGNYGNRWACGGTWSRGDRAEYDTLSECAPAAALIIANAEGE